MVRRVEERGRLGGAARRVQHFPEHALVQRQLGELQPEALRLGHERGFRRERQPLQTCDAVNRVDVYARFGPAAAVISMAARAQRKHRAQLLAL